MEESSKKSRSDEMTIEKFSSDNVFIVAGTEFSAKYVFAIYIASSYLSRLRCLYKKHSEHDDPVHLTFHSFYRTLMQSYRRERCKFVYFQSKVVSWLRVEARNFRATELLQIPSANMCINFISISPNREVASVCSFHFIIESFGLKT